MTNTCSRPSLHVLLTLFAEFFSPFDHSTCALSVTQSCLVLGGKTPPGCSSCNTKKLYSSGPFGLQHTFRQTSLFHRIFTLDYEGDSTHTLQSLSTSGFQRQQLNPFTRQRHENSAKRGQLHGLRDGSGNKQNRCRVSSFAITRTITVVFSSTSN